MLQSPQKAWLLRKLPRILLFLCLYFFVFVISCFFCDTFIIDTDWRFMVSHNMLHGYIPYRDFNCAVLPFYYWLYVPFLAISDTMFCFLLVSSFIIFAYMLSAYYLGRLIGLSEFSSILVMLVAMMCGLFSACDYNLLLQCLFMHGISLIYGFYNKKGIKLPFLHNGVYLGLLCSLMVLTKQTMGLIFSVALVAYYIWCAKVVGKSWFLYIRNCVLTSLVCAAAFIAWLFSVDAFYDCLDDVVLGIFRFTKGSSIFDSAFTSLFWYALIMTMLANALLFVITSKGNRTLSPLMFIGLLEVLSLHPLSNDSHMMQIVPIHIIMAVFSLSTIYRDVFAKLHTGLRALFCIEVFALYMSVLMNGLFGNTLTASGAMSGILTRGHVYADEALCRCNVPKSEYASIEKLVQYVRERPENNYNSPESFHTCMKLLLGEHSLGDFSCFLRGNTGTTPYEDSVASYMTEENDRLIILKDRTKCFWQTPSEVYAFIDDTYVIDDEFDNFVIYRNRKEKE